jgi:hypothetical protein
MSIPAEKAAEIWRFCNAKLCARARLAHPAARPPTARPPSRARAPRPLRSDAAMAPMRKQAASAMAQDTSTDHIDSKAIIAKVLYGFYQDEPSLQAGCTGVDSLAAFTQALAHNFLKEPALAARAELYETLGLPPPDETGGSLTSRLGMKS